MVDLSREMRRLGVREEDIRETFIRSRGPGGQNVNKTSTCVQVRHVPTGIEVRCQKERSQALNRYHARLLLLRKIEEARLRSALDARQRAEKERRKRRTRPRHVRLGILEEKRRRSLVKSLRGRVMETE